MTFHTTYLTLCWKMKIYCIYLNKYKRLHNQRFTSRLFFGKAHRHWIVQRLMDGHRMYLLRISLIPHITLLFFPCCMNLTGLFSRSPPARYLQYIRWLGRVHAHSSIIDMDNGPGRQKPDLRSLTWTHGITSAELRCLILGRDLWELLKPNLVSRTWNYRLINDHSAKLHAVKGEVPSPESGRWHTIVINIKKRRSM